MPAKITRGILESHIKCPYKCHLQLMGERGSVSDYESILREARARQRPHAVSKLIRNVRTPVPRDLPLARNVLKVGAPLLLDATLDDEEFSIHFDGLRRAEGPSLVGSFLYEPVLFHEGERLDEGTRRLLDVLGVLLGAVQGVEPRWATLILGRRCEIRRVKLGTRAAHAKLRLNQIKELRRSASEPRLRLNPHCPTCEFRDRCSARASAEDDLSLLTAMSEKEVNKYRRRGIFTVTQLSCTFRPRKSGARPEQRTQRHQHALKALAIRDRKVYVLGNPTMPMTAERIFFDLEGDPDRGFDYLLGMTLDINGKSTHHSIWIDSPANETRLLNDFLDIMGSYEKAQLYSYGSYEAAFLRRMLNISNRPDLALLQESDRCA